MKTNNVILQKERFADRAASGLKVEDWCKRNGITKHAYYYWHRKVQDDQLGIMENRFVEIVVNDPLKEKKAGVVDSEIIVNWKDFSIFINDQQLIPLLAELMQKLVRECCIVLLLMPDISILRLVLQTSANRSAALYPQYNFSSEWIHLQKHVYLSSAIRKKILLKSYDMTETDSFWHIRN